MGLEHSDDLCQLFIAHLLKHTEYTSLEENFGGSKLVLCGVELQSQQDFLGDDLAIGESLGNGIRGQDGVSGREDINVSVSWTISMLDKTCLRQLNNIRNLSEIETERPFKGVGAIKHNYISK